MTPELAARIVADSRDRVAWVRARSRGITATDVAALTSANAIARAADAKLMGSGFSGNAYTAHGRQREPEIARWVAATHGIQPSSALFHAVAEKRHLATPDGIGVDRGGRVTWPRSRRPTSHGAASRARIFVRSGGSSTSSAPSGRSSRGSSTANSSRSATSLGAHGSSAMRPRSPSSSGSRPRSSMSCYRRTWRSGRRMASGCRRLRPLASRSAHSHSPTDAPHPLTRAPS